MFRIITAQGLDIHFKQHNNGNWKATAFKAGSSFELSRSINPNHLPWVVDALVGQPDDVDMKGFDKQCRKLKKAIKKAIEKNW